MRKSGKLVSHMMNSNIAIGSLLTLQISLEIFALFENIYDGEPIITDFLKIGEDYNIVVAMKGIM